MPWMASRVALRVLQPVLLSEATLTEELPSPGEFTRGCTSEALQGMATWEA